MRRAGSLIVTVALCTGLFAPISVSQAAGHVERRVLSKTAPTYPELAKRRHLGRVVKLIVVVRANGTVKSTRVAGGSPLFIESAADAIRQWKLEPAREETTEVVQLVFEPR